MLELDDTTVAFEIGVSTVLKAELKNVVLEEEVAFGKVKLRENLGESGIAEPATFSGTFYHYVLQNSTTYLLHEAGVSTTRSYTI